MCGIAGLLHYNSIQDPEQRVLKMTNSLLHRGRDESGYYNDNSISLGHRRLSIIDLTSVANQPFVDPSNRYVMVYNGEIYNYKELKLAIPNYPFKTQSDTEVLMAAFCTWGIDCLKKIDGMFAFAIWDKQDEILWLARDRMGVKPLYFFQENGLLAFSSEKRSLMDSGLFNRSLNYDSVFEYLSYHSTGYPNSIVECIHQVHAGTYYRCTTRSTDQTSYWNFKSTENSEIGDPALIKRKVFNQLQQAVTKRLMSDVPIGAFLSGGVDSAAIVALMSLNSSHAVNTFALGFSEAKYDESNYAEIIAKRFGTNHTRFVVKPSDLLENVQDALDVMDSPSADGINTYILSKAIRETGLKVALSGIGGDELFAGYPGFRQYYRLNKVKKEYSILSPVRRLVSSALKKSDSNRKRRLGSILSLKGPSIDEVYPVLRQIISSDFINYFIKTTNETTRLSVTLLESKNDIEKFGLISQFSIAEYLGYSQNTLLKDTDQMSMAVGLEIREPFFDHQLIEYVLSLPDELKLSKFPKQLLFDSLDPLIPPEIFHRKKMGFVLPWEQWMRNELFSFCDDQIKLFSQRDFAHRDNILKYWKRFLQKDPSIRWIELWQIVVLEYWLRKNSVE